MPGKETTSRKKSADAVLSSIETHGDAAAKSLVPFFKGLLKKGETAPDIAFLLTLFGRALVRDSAAAVAADDAHEREKSDDDAPRAARDAAAVEVREACVHARDAVSTAHGTGAHKLLGMASPPPLATDGAALVRWADGAATALADATIKLPAAKPGIHLDRGALARGITAHLDALRTALADVERERRELEGTQTEKNRAIERYDATFSIVANITSAVLRAADMHDQADRVRPSARRPGRTEATDDDEKGGEK